MADVASVDRRDRSFTPRLTSVDLAVAVGAVLLAVLHVLWLVRFRFGYITDWDEAGYISIALADLFTELMDG